ncbi:UNVERIFIED_CONTAM: hypothetical protein Slati_3874300 [Sesamum latifolium]|uniref:Retrovirus-related Pol polyprotein from transposon TNT 1-94-like beta-barrel domain-containing protein n=1 Tax=Sesamum latifolium TaxID=2727402 RepID=A0AAW2TMG8_9LAMI
MLAEMLQLMKGKLPTDKSLGHFASMGEFAGTYLNATSKPFGLNSWIIDSGATTPMCAKVQLSHNIKPFPVTSSISLPDGSQQGLTHCGTINLSNHITLADVLHVSHFKYNLLSVTRLSASSHISFLFSPFHCLFQDQRTKRILAVGKLVGKLYVLDADSFSADIINKHSMNNVDESSLSAKITEADLW